MRKLTSSEIENLAATPGAKRIAVENFLSTVHYNPTLTCALRNLNMDAELYKWKSETVKAIKTGIKLASK
jgi:hypothetical protein